MKWIMFTSVFSRPNLIYFSFWVAKIAYFHPHRFVAWGENIIFAPLKLTWIQLCLAKTDVNVLSKCEWYHVVTNCLGHFFAIFYTVFVFSQSFLTKNCQKKPKVNFRVTWAQTTLTHRLQSNTQLFTTTTHFKKRS